MSDNTQVEDLIVNSREPGVPLYVQVYRNLIRLIKEGVFNSNNKLPSEPILSKQLGVGRSTLRMALLLLQEDGLVETIHGKGTFVKGSLKKVDKGFEIYRSVTERIKLMGMKPGTSHIEMYIQKADSFIAEQLNCQEGENILLVKRVRTADDTPVVVSQDFLKYTSITREDINNNSDSLTKTLENKLGLTIKYVTSLIRPTLAGDSRGKLLGINSSSHLLLVSSRVYDINENPVLFNKKFFYTEKIDYTIIQPWRWINK